MDGARGADMHAQEFFPLKRKSSDFLDKYVNGQAHEIENQGDLDGRYDHYLVSKKSRLVPSCSNQSLAQTLRLGLVSEINGNSNVQPSQSETANNTEKVSRGASGNGNHDYLSVGVVNDADLRASSVAPTLKTQNVDEGKIHTVDNLHDNEPANTMEHLSKEDNEFDNDGYDNERLKVSEKERNILNSPCKVNHGSSQVSESPVLNPCVKCNKEGSPLFCSSSNCSLGIHENCLGSPVKFDDQGNFYCPFCAYAHALSEYRKCTESVSSLKKEFHSFFNKNASHRPSTKGKGTTILDSTNQRNMLSSYKGKALSF
ncbi:uncharacterized protein LOC119995607 [Tripterygium wilfordii]|uniref:uncharacterized protein LOC119995607 n=1 Tax=Tripterygium wilfordii TaxID=458696 RepID=UPI0018F82298|nr:uncharacterized protein LOC119995607 [Tripterygium wilfordii]